MTFRMLALTLFLCLPSALKAQVDSTLEKILHQLERESQVNPVYSLYLHQDKLIYSCDEYIWFTAYLLDGSLEDNKVLSLLLIDQTTKKVVTSGQYIMTSGISQGALLLPCSNLPGKYRLVAYSNGWVPGSGQPPYNSMITLNGPAENGFSIKQIGTTEKGPDSVYVKYKVVTQNKGLASGGSFKYTLYANNQQQQTGTKTIDPFGEVEIRTRKPVAPGMSMSIETVVRHRDISKNYKLPVSYSSEVIVQWFPEGGQLVAGHPARLAYELTKDHRLVSLRARLLEDGQVIATLKSDEWGRGWIDLIPKSGKKYTIQPDDSLSKWTGNFPEVQMEGFLIRVEKSVVDDTITVQIRQPCRERNVWW